MCMIIRKNHKFDYFFRTKITHWNLSIISVYLSRDAENNAFAYLLHISQVESAPNRYTRRIMHAALWLLGRFWDQSIAPPVSDLVPQRAFMRISVSKHKPFIYRERWSARKHAIDRAIHKGLCAFAICFAQTHIYYRVMDTNKIYDMWAFWAMPSSANEWWMIHAIRFVTLYIVRGEFTLEWLENNAMNALSNCKCIMFVPTGVAYRT